MDKQEYIEQELEHMQVNSSECEYAVGLLVSDICRYWCLLRGTPEFGAQVDNLIDMAVQQEAVWRGMNKYEEKEGV